jgi:hypothetical protein
VDVCEEEEEEELLGASSFPGDSVRVVVVGEALGEAVAAQIGELLGSEDVASLGLLGVLLDGEDVDVVDAFFGLGVASLALLTFLGMLTGASAAASSKIGVYLLSSVYYTHVKSL